MAKPWKRLAASARTAERTDADEALHRTRILAKQVRYGSEAFAEIVGKPAKKLASRAEVLQDVLGDHQDAVTAIAWLGEHAARAASGEAAFAAGRLAQVEEATRRRARDAWPDAWRSLRGRKRFWT